MTVPILTAVHTLPFRAIWILVLATAFGIRVGAQALVGFYEDPFRWEYDEIARNIAEGRGYYYDFLGTRWFTFGLPALPLLSSAMYAFSGGTDRYVLIGLALASASAATAALASVAAERIAGRTTAVFAGLAVAFHPAYILYTSQIHELPLETLALALALVAFLEEFRRPTRASLIAVAIAASLAVFVRPTYGAFVLTALAVLVIRRREAFARILVIGVVVALTTLPWTIRTAAASAGTGTPLGPYSCLAIWMGNNPYAPGSTIAPDGRSWWDVQPREVQDEIWGRPEAEQGRTMCQQAGRFLTDDPLRSLNWWMTKWSWYWWISPQAGQFYPSVGLQVYLAVWAVAAVLGVLGSAALWRRGRVWEVLILLALVVPISLAQSFVYVDGRHRMEVEWAILLLSSVGLTSLVGWRRVRP